MIQEIEDKINHRPRKNLGWKTPYEVFYGVKWLPKSYLVMILKLRGCISDLNFDYNGF